MKSVLAHNAAPLILTTASVLFGTGCSSLASPNSPDVLYDRNATEARQLQVPPDLTDISNTEQFVLPGAVGATVARNTLLPQFESVRFVRDGAQSWLAFDTTPEELWPQILAFVRSETYRIDKTEPVAGVIATQWRPASAIARDGLLNNLINKDEEFSRVAFRLEREGIGARLFARSQVASSEVVNAENSSSEQWPASSHDPEATSALLSRLMVFLGIEQQKAQGIMSDEQAQSLLDDAVLQTTAAGNQLVLHRGFQPSFREVLSALQSLDFVVSSRDDGVGRIEFTADSATRVIEITPIHVSAVRVAVTDETGRKLDAEQERLLLQALQQKLV